MRKSTCFLLLIVFFSMAAHSQPKADSLKRALAHCGNEIDKANLLNAIAEEYKTGDPGLMVQYASDALELSRKIRFRLAQGNALLNLGNANVIRGDYNAALQHFMEAQKIFEKGPQTNSRENLEENNNGLARALGSIGIVFSEQSNYARALQYDLKAARIYEQSRNPEKCARLYNNIGIIYKAQGEDFKALDYFIKCLKAQQKTGDKSVGITLTNIGNCYRDQKNFAEALGYYAKARQFFARYPDARGSGELYNNLGLFYKKKGDMAVSLDHFQKAAVAFKAIGDKFGIADSYYYLGQIYFARRDYPQALANADKSLELATELGVLEQIRNAEELLSGIYEKTGRPDQAYLHFKRYSILRDSISNNENIRNSVRAEMNFEFDKKEALQKKEQEKKEILYQEQLKRHQLQIVFVVLFILLLFGIVFLIYNRSQLKKTLTLQKELAEYEQKALHLQMNPHFVFNCLGSISSFIVQNGTDSAIKYLSKFSKLMRLTLEYSKESLIPIDKEIESLQNYLELEQLRFNQKFSFGISKSSDIEDDMALPPLLLQPFVENAIIHGLIPKKEAGMLRIGFEIRGVSLICTITDDGIGFKKSQELKENLVSVHKSMALDITRKRLEMMEAFTSKTAQVSIDEVLSPDGNITGTKVVLTLPIQYITKN